MMTIKEQFISEIKERIALQKDLLKQTEDSARIEGSIDALLGLLAFLDTLPEEKPSEDLDEAANEYGRENVHYWYDEEIGDGAIYDDFEDLKVGFIAGAEWQKEQMMKEVKFGVVCKIGERDEEDVWIELNPGSLPDYKDTDPIDFIIVKQ